MTESPLWRILPELRIIPIGAYPPGCTSFGGSFNGGLRVLEWSNWAVTPVDKEDNLFNNGFRKENIVAPNCRYGCYSGKTITPSITIFFQKLRTPLVAICPAIHLVFFLLFLFSFASFILFKIAGIVSRFRFFCEKALLREEILSKIDRTFVQIRERLLLKLERIIFEV